MTQFNSVAQMKLATLPVGSTASTLGYTTPNDGGGAQYLIVTSGTGTDDGGSYHDLVGVQAELSFASSIKAQWYGVIPDGTDRSTQFQALVDFCSPAGIEVILPEGDTLIGSTVTVSSEGVSLLGSSRKNCTIQADGDYTVFEHTVRLVCRNFQVTQTSGSFEGIAFGTPRSDSGSAQAVYCIFDNIEVLGFDYSWWWRTSIWSSWKDCHSVSLVGIRLARNADPYDLGVPDAPAGWNTFSPSLGHFHNVGNVFNCNFEDEECGVWGSPMMFHFSACTTQRQSGNKALNKLLPTTEERTGLFIHSGTTGTKNTWSNTITSHYAEACNRPFYIQDQRSCEIITVFVQGGTMGNRAETPIHINNSIVHTRGFLGQDFYEENLTLENNAQLIGFVQGVGLTDNIDATSTHLEFRDQEAFSHQFSFTSTGTQTTTIPVTLENMSHYELHVGALFNGTTVETETYDIFRWNSDALTNIDTRSGGGTNFNVTVSGAQILVNATDGGALALATDVTLREVTKSITQDQILIPV